MADHVWHRGDRGRRPAACRSVRRPGGAARVDRPLRRRIVQGPPDPLPWNGHLRIGKHPLPSEWRQGCPRGVRPGRESRTARRRGPRRGGRLRRHVAAYRRAFVGGLPPHRQRRRPAARATRRGGTVRAARPLSPRAVGLAAGALRWPADPLPRRGGIDAAGVCPGAARRARSPRRPPGGTCARG